MLDQALNSLYDDWILGRFEFSQNEFEMRRARNRIEEGPLTGHFHFLKKIILATRGFDYISTPGRSLCSNSDFSVAALTHDIAPWDSQGSCIS